MFARLDIYDILYHSLLLLLSLAILRYKIIIAMCYHIVSLLL